jgi:hypothetical protein
MSPHPHRQAGGLAWQGGELALALGAGRAVGEGGDCREFGVGHRERRGFAACRSVNDREGENLT